MYRNTYAEINLKNIKTNVENLTKKFSEYKYQFGVVKADSYGHGGIEVVKTIIDAGCNYLAVATLDEAIEIRNNIQDIPILCLGIIPIEYLEICVKNNITVTISNLEYVNKMIENNLEGLKSHIKINTGMNRLGFKNSDEVVDAYNILNKNNINIEGIYTHIYEADNKNKTLEQYKKFEEITKGINLEKIPIIHLGASEATINYEKRSYANGCRWGVAMYGFLNVRDINFLPTFSVYSEVIQINEIENESVGYNGIYSSNKKEKIAVIPIGYADGIIRKNTGRTVYINNKEYEIVGNICMDMMFVKVDESVNVGDKVTVIKDINHIKKIAKHLDTISYEVMCSIGKRVPRKYIV